VVRLTLKSKFEHSTLGRSLGILSRRSRLRIVMVTIIQVAVSLLDLLGVALIGVLGALTVTGVQSRQPGDRVKAILDFFGVGDLPLQSQAAVLGAAAVTLFISRTLLTILFTKRTIAFLSRQGASLGSTLFKRILSQPLIFLQTRTSQDFVYLTTIGANSVTIGIIGTLITLLADISLLLVMGIGLFLFDPLIAIQTIVIFAVIAFVLYVLLQNRAKVLSEEQYRFSVTGNEQLLASLNSYREILIRNRRDYYASQNEMIRHKLSGIYAETTFMPNISKYAIEITVVLGSFIITGAQFLLQDATRAIATLTVFLAAGSRIAPAVLRVQQGAIQIKGSIGSARPTLDLWDELSNSLTLPVSPSHVDYVHDEFVGEILLDRISLKYPNKSLYALHDVSLHIVPGTLVALVGPSGAGKTSLVDVLLGAIEPTEGQIKISGLTPAECIVQWPGALAYVPQDVVISNTTIRENVSMGFPNEVVDESLILDALDIAQLKEFSQSLDNGIDTYVGERGAQISGGQRQRLGIARAMFTKPKLLVLDEATSALDGETESQISQAINSLKGSVTVVLIAHRLSTVRDADLVVYMDEGRIVATGSFEEVRAAVPDFARQAQVMGL
jgi:ABC-type multidrug transport system fused ATPase/permease subunit